jgi:hypothetical protein
MSHDLGHERTWNDDVEHAQPVGQTRGIPLEIVSNVASRNGVLESLARSDNVIGIRHRQTIEFVRVPKATGASWRQIGDSLGVSAPAACEQYGAPGRKNRLRFHVGRSSSPNDRPSQRVASVAGHLADNPATILGHVSDVPTTSRE